MLTPFANWFIKNRLVWLLKTFLVIMFPVFLLYYFKDALIHVLDDLKFMFREIDNHGEANARLIASAPDLLAALDGMVNMVDYAVDAKMNGSISNNCPTTEKARAAIAKAKVGAAWVKLF